MFYSFVFLGTFSRIVFVFAGVLVHFLIAIRSRMVVVGSPSGQTGLLSDNCLNLDQSEDVISLYLLRNIPILL